MITFNLISVVSSSNQHEPSSAAQTTPPLEGENNEKGAGFSGVLIFFIVLFAFALLIAIGFVGFKAYKT
jgi:hypothetical protein